MMVRLTSGLKRLLVCLALLGPTQVQATNQFPALQKKDLPKGLRKYAIADATITAFEKQGYVIIKKMLPRRQARHLRGHGKELIENFFAQHKKNPKAYQGGERIDFNGASIKLAPYNPKKTTLPNIQLISWIGAASPPFLAAGRSKHLLVPMAQILGSFEIDWLINQLHPKLVGDEVDFPLHQDIQNRRSYDPNWRDINGRGSFIQLSIALESTSSKNGGLCLIPLSDPAKDQQLDKKSPADIEHIKQTALKAAGIKQPLCPKLKAGDALLFHPFLLHYSPANHHPQRSRFLFINSAAFPGANQRPYPGKGSGLRIDVRKL